MDHDSLASSLERVVATAKPVRFDQLDDDPFFGWFMRRHWVDTELNNELITQLRAQPELVLFDDRVMRIASAWHQVGYGNLADWLVRRALDVGVDQTIRDLSRYVAEPDFPCLEVLALANIEVGDSLSLAQGIRLVPFSSVPESFGKLVVEDYHKPPVAPRIYNRRAASSALVREFRSPRTHDVEAPGESSVSRQESGDLWEACWCLTLIRPCVPAPLAEWVVPEDWVPCGHMGTGVGIVTSFELGPTTRMRDEDYLRAKDLHARFVLLSPKERLALMVPLSRLNSAMRRRNPVDAAIDIGVALEALFLNDRESDRGELSFTLRLRAARFLGADEADRRELAQFLGRLYGLRSAAVHTGDIPEKVGGTAATALLRRGYEITAQAIELVVRNGRPDWHSIVFE